MTISAGLGELVVDWAAGEREWALPHLSEWDPTLASPGLANGDGGKGWGKGRGMGLWRERSVIHTLTLLAYKGRLRSPCHGAPKIAPHVPPLPSPRHFPTPSSPLMKHTPRPQRKNSITPTLIWISEHFAYIPANSGKAALFHPAQNDSYKGNNFSNDAGSIPRSYRVTDPAIMEENWCFQI